MAWRHSESAGFGRDWYAERALHWLVRNVALHIRAAVTYGDGGRPDHRGHRLAPRLGAAARRDAARRGHALMPAAADASAPGEVVAVVETDWVLLGADGRPARMPDEIAAWFAAAADLRAQPRPAARRRPPEATRLATRVRPLDVDPMGHMNNAAYLDVVDEVMAHLPPAGDDLAPDADPVGCHYRVGYLRPALPGARLERGSLASGRGLDRLPHLRRRGRRS